MSRFRWRSFSTITWSSRSRRQIAYESLCNAVLPRAFERSANGFHAKDFRRCQDLSAESGVAVVNQIARRCVERKCLAQLLTHPGAGWMSRHIEMKNSPPIMGDDEEAIENAEGECWHGEEVHCGDGFAVIAQKRRPSLRRFRVSRRLPHPTQHGSLRDVEAEHLELAVDARRSPGGVLGDHAEDQYAQFLARWPSPNTGTLPRDPFPIELESGAMPADDRLRLDDEERLLPAGPEPAEANQNSRSGTANRG